MLHDIFYFVLNMSITSAAITAVIIITRAVIGRWVPKSYIYPLWMIALFRMLIPVSIPSSLSLMNLVGGYITKSITIPKATNIIPNVSVLNSIKGVNGYFPLEYKSHAIENLFAVSGIVWVCGAVLFVIASFIIYNLTASRLKKAIPVKNSLLEKCMLTLNIKRKIGLYESDFVSSPIVVGILKPRIVVPKALPEETLEYALLHELSHIMRYDNLWRLIFIFAVCLHWFNPFAWLLLHMSGQDMEHSCDERVLKNIKDCKRKNYAGALALLAAKQRMPLTSFGSTAVRMRIIKIVSYKRLSLLMAAVLTVICIVFAVLLLTNPLL